MGSALQAVLALKANEQAQEQQRAEQLNQGLQMLQQARQQAQQNQLQQLQLRAGLAEKGLVQDPNSPSGFRKDTSLMSSLDMLLQKGKAAEAAQTLGDRGLFNQITGNTAPQPTAIPQNNADAQLYEQANQIDPFTKKPTAQADQAMAQLASKRDIQKDHEKQLFTSRKAFDTYQSDANQALVALDKIEGMAKELPKFDRGFWGQATGKMSAGLKEFSKDKDITRYQGVVAQELIPMARKLMEEKGPITEWDVNRVEKGFGDLTTPLEDKMFLVGELRDKVKQALITKSKIAEISPNDLAGKYSEVFKKASRNSTSSGWTPEKEARLQELRKKLGK